MSTTLRLDATAPVPTRATARPTEIHPAVTILRAVGGNIRNLLLANSTRVFPKTTFFTMFIVVSSSLDFEDLTDHFVEGRPQSAVSLSPLLCLRLESFCHEHFF